MTEGINIYFECFLTGLCSGAQKAAPAEEHVGVLDSRGKDEDRYLGISYNLL